MFITDNQYNIPLQHFQNRYPNLFSKLANTTIKKLIESENILLFPNDYSDIEDIDSNSRLFDIVNDKVNFNNLIGFLEIGNEKLIIKSRFSNSEHDHLIHYLLESVLNASLVNLDSSVSFEEQIFEFLKFMFPKYLNNAMRKGPYKEYITVEYNDSSVSGRIDINRHIKQNIPFQGKVAYTRREFSFDNDLTELIRHTVEFLSSDSPSNRSLLKQSLLTSENIESIIELTPGYSRLKRQSVIHANITKPIKHAYFHEYRKLQELCILLLQHQKHGFNGSSTKVNGVLFDVAWLWEEYLATLLEDSFIHPKNKIKKGKQYLFHGNLAPIYPDFIGINSYVTMIVDAKYKRFSNIRNNDYHQMLSYLYRFRRNVGIFAFPWTEDSVQKQTERFHLLSGFDKDVEFMSPKTEIAKYGVLIPMDSNLTYRQFSELMSNSESNFRNFLSLYSVSQL